MRKLAHVASQPERFDARHIQRRLARMGAMSNRGFGWILGTLSTVGAVIGYRLSYIPGLRAYKLLNIGGLILAFRGFLVLSEILASEWWKAFCINRIAPVVLWAHSIVPLGAAVGGVAGQIMRKPSAPVVMQFSIGFWGYSLLALGTFNEIVVFPQLPFFKKDVETRWRWMGFLIVLSGVLAQLVAAIMDLAG